MNVKDEAISKFGSWETFKKLVEKLECSGLNKPSLIADEIGLDFDIVAEALFEINEERERQYFELTGDLL